MIGDPATLLVIDVGNTHIKLGVRQGREWSHEWRLSTDIRRTADEYRLSVRGFLTEAGLAQVETVILGSVVPFLTPSFVRMGETLSVNPVLEITPPGYGMRVRYCPPESLGTDRFVNAIGAWSIVKRSVVVVDVGTTITVDAVSDQGEFLGGAIAPGPHLMAQALAEGTARLPHIPPIIPDVLSGASTAEAIQVGVGQGLVGSVDRLVRRTWRLLGEDSPVVLTGGWGARLEPHLEFPVRLESRLTLDGLAVCADWVLAGNAPDSNGWKGEY